MSSMFEALSARPIIAAVRERAHLETALRSPLDLIFMMGGAMNEIGELVRRTHEADKRICLHVELVKGLGRDREAIEYLAEHIRPDGIVSTKPHLVQTAVDLGLTAVLQIFMIDTQAFLTGLNNIESTRAHAVEIMPGLMPSIIAKLAALFDIPIITAGLIKRPEEVRMMLDAGASGLAISEQSLWRQP